MNPRIRTLMGRN